MNPWPVEEEIAEVHLPRPGHADLVGTQKYKQSDVRNILERASARETAARVAGGALCKAFLRALGVEVRSHVDPDRLGPRAAGRPRADARGLRRRRRARPCAAWTPTQTRAMVREIDDLRKANESLGGVFEVQAFGLVPGLGSHVSWEERIDGRLAMAICSIQAVKGVGDRRRASRSPGSRARRRTMRSTTPHERGYYRETNHAGGLEGGMTNGLPLLVRGAMKPLPTLTKPLRSVDTATHEPAQALRERTDSCTVPAAGVVGEAMVAFVLADAYRRKFGGDHIDDVQQASAPTASGSDGRRGGTSRRALVLIGFMGAGKSTVARELARALGTEALDSDDVLSARFGHSPAEEFERNGEASFRAAEEQVVCELLDSAKPGAVIALGGGSVLSERVRTALEPHVVVLLDIEAAHGLGARERRAEVSRCARAPARTRPRGVPGAARRAPRAV